MNTTPPAADDEPPPTVDSLRFCSAAQSAGGQTRVAQLTRLAESLASPDGSVRWTFHGSRRRESDGSNSDWLDLRAGVSAFLPCARCDEPAPFEATLTGRFLLVAEEAVAARLDEDAEDYDVLVASHRFSLSELLEDECLMALPQFVVHTSCEPASSTEDATERPNPFAALAGLRKGPAQ